MRIMEISACYVDIGNVLPKPLDITPTTTTATATTGTDTTPTSTSISTAATRTDTSPPVSPTITADTGTNTTPTSPVTIPTVITNTTPQGDTEETNPNSEGPATSPHPPPVASGTPTTRNRGGKRREKGKTRNLSQQQQGSKLRYHHTPNHQNTTQRPRQTPVKVCEYCKRRGHIVEDCHQRTADQRQARLLRQILAEGRHSDPPFPSAAPPQPNLPLQPNLPQSRPTFPQPDTWRQNQGLQWIPTHQYPYITTPQQRHHTLTHFPLPSWHVQGQGVPVTN
ncbi:hypothetical protein Pmani_026816 [Petrolisthes manimaculis]|uniref:CCHC-type domain-containing protein n=1 Tax=Petrolisthes manimaculis TaxID=1843537 RepID=A0AAE1P2U9_9EUCA|nr:hypothetical protein Pmani_026816 [Petrolisthes manimaculis]